MFIRLPILFFLAAAAVFAAETNYDVVVYGGTPGGVAAAVAAAREGASVILLEEKQHVGGLTTSGLCNSEVVHMQAWTFSGISGEFYQRLAKAYGKPGLLHTWESKVAQKVFDEMLAEAKVTIRYKQRIDKAEKNGARIVRITLTDGSQIAGKVFIDCSYEGDLMARAGVSSTFGRESKEQYGEELAGVRLSDKPVRAKTRDEKGQLLPGIIATADQLKASAADPLVQNYNFRLTMTKDPQNKVPFPKPKSYDPQRYTLLANYLVEHPHTKFSDIVAYWPIAPGKFEANNHQAAVISLGHFGGQRGYPEGDYAARDRIYQDHVDYTQGLFWFTQHDPRSTEALRKQTAEWGLAKDEFVDNDNWPYYLYIREARRMLGAYVMTQKDVQTDRKKPDSIGLGSHYIDCHHVQRVAVSDTEFCNEGRLWVVGKVYEIPYRALTPKPTECENLLVPVAASFSHVAFCPYRLEPTWMAAGHASGVAATIAAKANSAIQNVEMAALQAKLAAQGQLLRLKDGDEGK